MQTLKQLVIVSVDPDTYYKSRFPQWDPKIRANVKCPFHTSRSATKHFAVGLNNGGCKCWSSNCQKSFGNIVHFESVLKGVKEIEAARIIYKEFVRKCLPIKRAVNARENLLEDSRVIAKIVKSMGLTPKTQGVFSLGFDHGTRKVQIPIHDAYGNLINIRHYILPEDRWKGCVKIHNEKGFGGGDLFPAKFAVDFKPHIPVYFAASEKEAMLFYQQGAQAFCVTSGEGSWDSRWDSWIKDFDVIIVFNTDEAGVRAANNMQRKLATLAKSVRVATIPFKTLRKDRKDFADFVLKEQGHYRKLKVANQAKPTKVSSPPSVHADEPERPSIVIEGLQDLSTISSCPIYQDKIIITQGIVAAKSQISFMVPWKFKLTVRSVDDNDAVEVIDFSLGYGRNLLQFVKTGDFAIAKILGALTKREVLQFEILKRVPCTEIEVIPIAATDSDAPYIVQRCYYFGFQIESNVSYQMTVVPVAEMRTQESLGMVINIEPLSRAIDRFVMDNKTARQLRIFQPENESSWACLERLADRVANQFTRIYQRPDLHIIALLTWASPLHWRFPHETELTRGWLNSLVLGDTETGKSVVCKRLKSLFDCGVYISSENCSFVGLIGGAIKMSSGQLMLRWGRIPLSDRQLIILEELSGLSTKQIADMSDVRSSGIARIDKGGISAETRARTRLICLSNVRGEGKNCSSYRYGVLAVNELIGQPEDVARFDLITTVTDREVSADIINAKQFAIDANIDDLPADRFKLLIRFIWSLKPEQIHITDQAYTFCLKATRKLAETYAADIPIFKAGSGRYKIARIAIAIACLQFAWSKLRQQIVVTKDHMKAAVRLLQFIYGKESFGYTKYSQTQFERNSIGDTTILSNLMKEYVEHTKLTTGIDSILNTSSFTINEFGTYFGTVFMYSLKIISEFAATRIITKADRDQWQVTAMGREWLTKFLQNNK